MKRTHLLLFIYFLSAGCYLQDNVQVVKEFVESYNNKDSTLTFDLLHEDFVELWEKEIVINSKIDYTKNFSWGKVMNDFEEIEIVKSDSSFVETISTYHSDRDKLLGISPYKSKRVYKIANGKIVKIIAGKFDGYLEYDKPRRQQYQLFFDWLLENYNMKQSDFPFDKNGATALKEKIIEYSKN